MTHIINTTAACLLLGAFLATSSCVRDEENLFGSPAAERMRQTLEEYSAILTGAENGWFLDYYPEKNLSAGGYSMFLKFLPDGRVAVACETETNLPPAAADTSRYDLLAEQGPVLSFSTYNRVMHYFSEPYSHDIDGRAGDYEFVIVGATRNEVTVTGKKRGTTMRLQRNAGNPNPAARFDSVARIVEDATKYGAFRLAVNNRTVDSMDVRARTLVGKTRTLSFAYTAAGIRFNLPFAEGDVTMWNFDWNAQTGRFVCTDPGVSAYLEGYYPAGHQLKYEDFLGEWEMSYVGLSSTATLSAKVNIAVDKRNASFLLSSAELFSFAGVKLSYDTRTGTVALLNHNAALHSNGLDYIRLCMVDMAAGYINYSLNEPVPGLAGVWNGDQGGQRRIIFIDNRVWGTYTANGILLRLFTVTNNASAGNYTGNKGGYIFTDIIITKK
jgi:hypothetical protein